MRGWQKFWSSSYLTLSESDLSKWRVCVCVQSIRILETIEIQYFSVYASRPLWSSRCVENGTTFEWTVCFVIINRLRQEIEINLIRLLVLIAHIISYLCHILWLNDDIYWNVRESQESYCHYDQCLHVEDQSLCPSGSLTHKLIVAELELTIPIFALRIMRISQCMRANPCGADNCSWFGVDGRKRTSLK